MREQYQRYWEEGVEEQEQLDADFDNIYSDTARESYLDDDMLSAEEEAFMRGYEQDAAPDDGMES